MKFTKFLVLCIVFIHSCPHGAQNLLVHIFSQNKIQSIELEVIQGSYQLQSTIGFLSEINEGQSLSLQVNSSNQIHVAKNGTFLGLYDSLFLFQSSHADYIRFSPQLFSKKYLKSREYEGCLLYTSPSPRDR